MLQCRRAAGWLGMAIDGDPLKTAGRRHHGAAAPDLRGRGHGQQRHRATAAQRRWSAAPPCFAPPHCLITPTNSRRCSATTNWSRRRADPGSSPTKAGEGEVSRDHIEGVRCRHTAEEAEKEFDVTAKSTSAEGRIWRELSPHHVLYFTDGTPFWRRDGRQSEKISRQGVRRSG